MTNVVLLNREKGADTRAVQLWLYAMAAIIFVMVLVGGATRLTDSGLSITEWKPVTGIVPPLSESAWQEEFAKYKKIPEYQQINKGMSLDEFKGIFWWEWGHRFLGRMIGFAFLIPFLYFWRKGAISPDLRPKLIIMFVLGGLQGALGWYMVKSGLSVRVDVSQYRLAAHLTAACVIFAYIIWVAVGLNQPEREERTFLPAQRITAWALIILTLGQIFLGGLVAGLDAGLAYNTWPLMDGAFIPAFDKLFIMKPVWVNFFENVLTVQFDHRMLAYAIFAVGVVNAWQAGRATGEARAFARWTGFAIGVQVLLGVLTLLHNVPMDLALAHQGGAVIVLALAVAQARHLKRLTF